MKYTRHAWGRFSRYFNHALGQWSPWKLVSTHKTSTAAESFRHRGEYVRRLTKEERQ